MAVGVSSYSCLRYAMLIKLYLDYLDPDMVVVAIDQSDFKEDNDRAGHYQFDRHGDPEILKNASELMSEKGQHRIYIDDEGNLIVEPRGRNWLVDLRVASALFNNGSTSGSRTRRSERERDLHAHVRRGARTPRRGARTAPVGTRDPGARTSCATTVSAPCCGAPPSNRWAWR